MISENAHNCNLYTLLNNLSESLVEGQRKVERIISLSYLGKGGEPEVHLKVLCSSGKRPAGLIYTQRTYQKLTQIEGKLTLVKLSVCFDMGIDDDMLDVINVGIKTGKWGSLHYALVPRAEEIALGFFPLPLLWERGEPLSKFHVGLRNKFNSLIKSRVH